MYVSVKAKKGRVAYTASRGGELIPEDRYISAEMTPWLDRLLNHHEDIVLEPVQASENNTADAPAPVAKAGKTAPAA